MSNPMGIGRTRRFDGANKALDRTRVGMIEEAAYASAASLAGTRCPICGKTATGSRVVGRVIQYQHRHKNTRPPYRETTYCEKDAV